MQTGCPGETNGLRVPNVTFSRHRALFCSRPPTGYGYPEKWGVSSKVKAKFAIFFLALVFSVGGEGKNLCAEVAAEAEKTSLRHDLVVGGLLMGPGYAASAMLRSAYDLHSHFMYATYSNTVGSFVFAQPLMHFLEKSPLLKPYAAPLAFGLGVAGNLFVESIWRGASLDIPDVLGGVFGTAVGLGYYRMRTERSRQ